MGTQYYDSAGSGSGDYPVTDLIQMIGRASRPGLDDVGKVRGGGLGLGGGGWGVWGWGWRFVLGKGEGGYGSGGWGEGVESWHSWTVT